MNHSSFTKCIAGLLLGLTLILPAGFSASLAFISPQRAHAFDILDPLGVDDEIRENLFPGDFISEQDQEQLKKSFAAGAAACAASFFIIKAIGLIPGLEVPIEDGESSFKESFIDCLFYNVINVLIENMIRSLTRWVQSGFKGNPVFVTNADKMFRDTINQMAGEFINTELAFLCSPFKADVQIALTAFITNDRPRFQCSLTDIAENVEDFINGDFFAGGWDAWYALYLDDNPYLDYMEARDELSLRIQANIAGMQKEIDLGRGFLSIKMQECYAFLKDGRTIPYNPKNTTLADLRAQYPDQIDSYECDPEKISTPGAFIENQIEHQFNIPANRLAFADELNELIFATMMFLIRNIFFDDEGLAGYDPNRSQWATSTPTLPDVPIPDLGNSGPTTPSDDAQPGPIGATQCFEENGVFLDVAPGNEYKLFNLPLPAGTSYNRITLDVDVFNGGWNEQDPGASHILFWLARQRHRNLFGLGSARGPNRNILIMRHGVGQIHGAKPKVTRNAALAEDTLYHVRYVYDAQSKTIEMVITNKDSGAVVSRMASVPDVPGINVGNQTFKASFSSQPVAVSGVAEEPPTYGWRYSDLKVVFSGQGGEPASCARPAAGGSGGGSGGGPNDGPDDGNSL